jgi:hypothetical protein
MLDSDLHRIPARFSFSGLPGLSRRRSWIEFGVRFWGELMFI